MKRRPLPVVDDLPLSALSPVDALAFVSGWRPPTTDRDREVSRWATWAEFFETWMRVEHAWRASSLPQTNLFVHCALRYQQCHGLEALNAASHEDIKTD